jgi:sulfide dehydrogenase cytochrome subunit
MNYIQICFLTLALALPGAVFSADVDTLSQNCNDCHGPQGVSTDSDMPSIAGQTAQYIADTLSLYQEWGRPCRKSPYRHGDTSRPVTSMCELAAGLGNDDIEALSNYYAELPFVAAQQQFDATKAAAGAQLYAIHCESCHPQGGSVSGLGPILAGQWMPYLKAATHEALTGEHLVPPLMEKPLADFSDEEIEALMNFFGGQQD